MSQRAPVVHVAPKSASSTAVISLSVYTILMQRCATFSTAHHSSKCMLLLTTQTSECDTTADDLLTGEKNDYWAHHVISLSA